MISSQKVLFLFDDICFYRIVQYSCEEFECGKRIVKRESLVVVEHSPPPLSSNEDNIRDSYMYVRGHNLQAVLNLLRIEFVGPNI